MLKVSILTNIGIVSDKNSYTYTIQFMEENTFYLYITRCGKMGEKLIYYLTAKTNR
jgi:hypothetical protein